MIPTAFGTATAALAAAAVPPTGWQGDNGVGVAVSSIPGSMGAVVLVDGADAIFSSTSAPGAALLPAVGDWARTVPAGTRADAAK